MTLTVDVLREEILRDRAGKGHWRCSPTLKGKIVQFAQQERRRGVGLKALAASLGVSVAGLSRWIQPAKSKIRAVKIVERTAVKPLVLITPGGSRLEGLDLSSATELLRRLES